MAVNEWTEFYNNTRSLGMGGAGIAITSDETSLFRNPANLGSIRDFYGTILDPELEASKNFTNQVSSGSTSKAFDISEIKNSLDSNRGTYYHGKAQLTPSFVRRNFGFGLIYKNEVSAEMNTAGTQMDTKYQSDMGAIMGTDLRLFDGRIKIGGSAKIINRIEVNNSTLSTSGALDLASIASEGTAIAFDGGLLLQAPLEMLPTIGAVVHDVGGTTFDKKDGVRMSTTSRPETVKQSIDVAATLFPIHGNGIRSVWTLEYSDLANSRNDTDSAKRMHAGLEINYHDLLFVRAGYNQRYYTAGFEIASEHFQWQIATYGEEIGTADTPREDRRYNTKFSLRF
ncbi:MAG: hypothetical protein H7256_03845 [Bdellovibrio sp.]|nr:hypothetical protein [Bdellovibrio sp.]